MLLDTTRAIEFLAGRNFNPDNTEIDALIAGDIKCLGLEIEGKLTAVLPLYARSAALDFHESLETDWLLYGIFCDDSEDKNAILIAMLQEILDTTGGSVSAMGMLWDGEELRAYLNCGFISFVDGSESDKAADTFMYAYVPDASLPELNIKVT